MRLLDNVQLEHLKKLPIELMRKPATIKLSIKLRVSAWILKAHEFESRGLKSQCHEQISSNQIFVEMSLFDHVKNEICALNK